MQRLSTGVSELDLVLGEGLEPGSLVILSGAPGTGKTIMAQQICFANATPEHKAICYTTLSEPVSKLIRHLEPFDFFDADALEARVEFIHLGELARAGSADGLGAVVAEVVRRAFDSRPSLVVIDSAKALRDFADATTLRAAFFEMAGRVGHTETVLLLVGEYTNEELQGTAEFSVADAIIQLAYEPHEPIDRRWLRVIKMRGAAHLQGKHSFRIGRHGFEVLPRLEEIAPERGAALNGRLSSGIPGLDEMMGGGIPAGDATVILGPSGCGKTIMGLRFLARGLEEGERGLYVSFQENANQLLQKAASFGWDLRSAHESGSLAIHHVPPGNLNLDWVGAIVRKEMAHAAVKRVVLDSLAELVFAARESERFPAYARALMGFIRAGGASAIVTSETSTLGPMAAPAGGLSFLFHNVVLLRYVEIGSEVQSAVNILKMRDSSHAKNVRLVTIDGQGMTIGDKLEGMTGVLGWSALRAQPPLTPS